jgi:MFS superfamily sulfate permease-like transporter
VQAVTMQGGERSGLRRYVSVLDGVRPYQRGWLQRDIVAGITLAALAIPEVMAYAKIAGMPVLTGLYTILLPIVAFALFGPSRHLVVGADSATAAIMFAGIARLGTAGLQPATPKWVALAGLSALLAGGLSAARMGGGGGGIRTHGAVRPGDFQGRCLRPLGHSSAAESTWPEG